MDYKDVDAENHNNGGGGNDEDDDDVYGLGPNSERNRKSYTSL